MTLRTLPHYESSSDKQLVEGLSVAPGFSRHLFDTAFVRTRGLCGCMPTRSIQMTGQTAKNLQLALPLMRIDAARYRGLPAEKSAEPF